MILLSVNAVNSLRRSEAEDRRLPERFLKNAPVLLLDEATSALDNENGSDSAAKYRKPDEEQNGYCCCTQAVYNRKCADIIYVIEHGRVVQLGTHEDLKQQDGVYAELVKLSNAFK